MGNSGVDLVRCTKLVSCWCDPVPFGPLVARVVDLIPHFFPMQWEGPPSRGSPDPELG